MADIYNKTPCRRSTRFFLIIVMGIGLLVSTIHGWGQQGGSVHVVQKGDTLYSLSHQYGVSIETLIAANNIKNAGQLSIGKELNIPAAQNLASSNPSLVEYIVQRGDTYYGIARRFGMASDELLQLNNRQKTQILRIGDTIQIRVSPDASSPSPLSSASPILASAAVNNDNGNIVWPHSGTRRLLTGKFPGVSIQGDAGDEVHSVAAGRVIYTGAHAVFRQVVLVQNKEGYIYIYGGQRDISVLVGDTVAVGEMIGKLDVASNREAQLYFSVWFNDDWINPDTAPRG